MEESDRMTSHVIQKLAFYLEGGGVTNRVCMANMAVGADVGFR